MESETSGRGGGGRVRCARAGDKEGGREGGGGRERGRGGAREEGGERGGRGRGGGGGGRRGRGRGEGRGRGGEAEGGGRGGSGDGEIKRSCEVVAGRAAADRRGLLSRGAIASHDGARAGADVSARLHAVGDERPRKWMTRGATGWQSPRLPTSTFARQTQSRARRKRPSKQR